MNRSKFLENHETSNSVKPFSTQINLIKDVDKIERLHKARNQVCRHLTIAR